MRQRPSAVYGRRQSTPGRDSSQRATTRRTASGIFAEGYCESRKSILSISRYLDMLGSPPERKDVKAPETFCTQPETRADFFYFFARNALKSPDSDEKNQGNPSSFLLGFMWICLERMHASVESGASVEGSAAGPQPSGLSASARQRRRFRSIGVGSRWLL